ncbi:MAG: ABC transporter permease [Acetivibrionales bacterium]|jgi:ABC-2 type transport system permease protein
MRVLVGNELYKSFRSKKIYIILLILFAVTLLTGIMIKHDKDLEESGLIEKYGGPMFPVTNLYGITEILFPIFIILFVTAMITDEYQNGTFKLPLLHGCTRSQMFHAKLLSQFSLIVILFLSTFIFSYISGTILWGSKVFSYNEFIAGLKRYGLTLLPFLAFTLVVYFIGLNISNSGIAIGTALTLVFVSAIIGQFLKEANPYLITFYFKAFLLDLTNAEIIKGCFVSFGYGLLFYGLSRFSLANMDILK